MAKMIIEERNQNSKIRVYHKVDHFPVTIGRSFDNDVITDDPYVSEQHLQIQATDDETRWCVRDLDSDNGSFLVKDQRIMGDAEIHSGDVISIGDSSFLFCLPNHPVEPALKWHPIPQWVKTAGEPRRAWGASLLFMIFVLMALFLETSEQLKTARFITAGFAVLVLLLGWAAIWAMIGRVVTHSAGFHRQLAIIAVVLLIAEPVSIALEYVEFFTSSLLLGKILAYGFGLAVVAFIVNYSLAVATNLIKSKRLIASAFAASLFIGLTMASQLAKEQEFSATPEYSSIIKPVLGSLLPATEPDQFWETNINMAKQISIDG